MCDDLVAHGAAGVSASSRATSATRCDARHCNGLDVVQGLARHGVPIHTGTPGEMSGSHMREACLDVDERASAKAKALLEALRAQVQSSCAGERRF